MKCIHKIYVQTLSKFDNGLECTCYASIPVFYDEILSFIVLRFKSSQITKILAKSSSLK